MQIFPAIDLYNGKAVRLRKGNFKEMTVYSDEPLEIISDFIQSGAKNIHLVDLEGAKDGCTKNFETLKKILSVSSLFSEVGGGIRNIETVKKYLDAGASRVIIGTAAIEDADFLKRAVSNFNSRIAVGADVKNGFIAVKGWLSESSETLWDFAQKMQNIGVKTLICTDISRDGEMRGSNNELYKKLKSNFDMEIIASGGVSSIKDTIALRDSHVDGAIIGKAYYEGAINLNEAVRTAE